MSILIKGMEMPTTCYDCPMNVMVSDGDVDWHYECCLVHDHIARYADLRLHDCPLVPVPPHGDLIDRNELKENCMKEDSFLAELLFRKVSNAPTIIPAEEGE